MSLITHLGNMGTPASFGGERKATCHPTEKHYCKGLCQRCYQRERMRRVRGTDASMYMGTTRRRSARGWVAAIAKKLDRSTGCWIYTGSKNAGGYGVVGPRRGVHRHRWLVHRVMYELLMGEIPADRHLDHLCRNRACCNPAHLEPVTHSENNRRGWLYRPRVSVCPRGHKLTPENVRLRRRKTWVERECRQCKREREWKRYWREKGRAAWLAA